MNSEHTTTSSMFLNEHGAAVAPPPPPKDGTPVSTLALDIPLSPVSPSGPPFAVEKSKKYSPLIDLIESEKAYVEILTGIIRNVAAAWSRSNLPPRQLDLMFRSVEGVYKTNRTLLMRLKDIGENPSSPKALGDLLMRWIDELEQPYMTYADRYCIGFDDWEPVKSNPKLSTVLQAFSTSNPPPPSLLHTRSLDPALWTLDALFLLPKGRLQYYRKLYSRLLRSMTPGRSDHRLLTGALTKLDGLLATLDEKANTIVGTSQSPPLTLLLPHVNTDASSNTATPSTNEVMQSGPLLSGHFGADSASAAPSVRSSVSSKDERLSRETVATSLGRQSSRALSSPILDLEKRLSTENTLDIFTMQPKQIRLQIAPQNLPYAREIRISLKVVVRFTPKATGVEVVHHHGHIYILSDLFFLCEEMAREEIIAKSEDGQDMHLCYPPLSGKVLSVTEVSGQESALQVSIMRKETLILETDSRHNRDRVLNEFRECISFAKTISRAVQEPVPPIPPTATPPQSPVTRLKISESYLRQRPERALNPRLLPQSKLADFHPEAPDDATSMTDRTPAAASPQNDGLSMTSLSRSPSERQIVVLGTPISSPVSPINGRVPTLHNPIPKYLPRRSSAGQAANDPPSSFVPGQIIPPVRSASVQSQSPPCVIATSDPPGVYPPPIVSNSTPQYLALRHHGSMHSLRQQPTQHEPSLQSPSLRANYQNFPPHPHPHPHPGPHSNEQVFQAHFPPHPHPHPHPGRHSNEQVFQAHPSSPLMLSLSQPTAQPSHKLQKSLSSHSLHSQFQPSQAAPPSVPSLPDGLPMPQRPYNQRKDSIGSLNKSRALLPSMQMGSRTNSVSEPSILDPSPPSSPIEERKPLGPVQSVITAQMKCKVFLQQQHAQWKSLGSANLTLYRQEPTNVKQLVVEAGSKERSILISTIVLTDGVERVGKTGVAIELSDAGGARTGVIYMIQLRNEEYASGLFRTLLAGSDRAT